MFFPVLVLPAHPPPLSLASPLHSALPRDTVTRLPHTRWLTLLWGQPLCFCKRSWFPSPLWNSRIGRARPHSCFSSEIRGCLLTRAHRAHSALRHVPSHAWFYAEVARAVPVCDALSLFDLIESTSFLPPPPLPPLARMHERRLPPLYFVAPVRAASGAQSPGPSALSAIITLLMAESLLYPVHCTVNVQLSCPRHPATSWFHSWGGHGAVCRSTSTRRRCYSSSTCRLR